MAIFSNNYPPKNNGVARAVSFLVDALVKEGLSVRVFVPKYRKEDYVEPYVIPVRSFGIPSMEGERFPIWLLEADKIFSEVVAFAPDVIHSHHPLLLGKCGMLFGRHLHIPTVFTYHTLFEHWVHYYPVPQFIGEAYVRRAVKRIAHLSTYITAPNDAMRDKLIREGVQTPIEVIPSGLPLEHFEREVLKEEKAALRKELRVLPDARILLYVGRIAKEKDIELLVRAFALSAQVNEDAVLCLVGDGPEEHNIRRLVEELKLAPRVVWAGRRTYEELPAFYRMSTAFVFASTTDTQALVLYEAMASGLPVVAVRSSASEEAVKAGDGILTENTIEDFARGMREIVKRRSEFSPAFPAHVDIRETSRRMLECYEKAIEEYKGKA